MSIRFSLLLLIVFAPAVHAEERIVVIDFWAPWCRPCVEINQHLDELVKEMDGQFRLLRVNIDEEPKLAKRFDVASLPTVVVTRDDEVLGRFRGLRSKKEIRIFIEKALHRRRVSQVSYTA